MTPVIAALITSTVAAAVNVAAGRYLSRHPDRRKYRAEPAFRYFVATFAAGYSLAFLWLLLGDVSQGDWSATLIWVTPLAFAGPWTLGAAAELVYRQGRKEAANGHNPARRRRKV